MKKLILISFALTIVAATGLAQPEKKAKKTPEERTEKIVTKLSAELALNDSQKAKVKEIVLKREKEHEKISDQFEKDRNTFKEASKKNIETGDEQLKSVLTPEQMEKLKAGREEMKQKHKDKKGKRPHGEQKKDNEAPAPSQK